MQDKEIAAKALTFLLMREKIKQNAHIIGELLDFLAH